MGGRYHSRWITTFPKAKSGFFSAPIMRTLRFSKPDFRDFPTIVSEVLGMAEFTSVAITLDYG